MKSANLALSFALELCALAAAGQVVLGVEHAAAVVVNGALARVL